MSNDGEQEYDCGDIVHLSLVECIRSRPSMYIGGVDEHGLLHSITCLIEGLFYECWDTEFQRFSITARGDRMEIQCREFDVPLELLHIYFTELDRPNRIPELRYRHHGGLHAAYETVIPNAVSRYFRAAYRRGSVEWSTQFEMGVIQETKVAVPSDFQLGLWLELHPDSQIFGDTKINITALRNWLQHTARVIPNLSIEFCNLETHTEEYIACPEGMVAQVAQMLDYHGLDRMAYPEVIHLSDWTGDFRIDVAFSHHSFLNDHAVAAYCNGEHNAVGGAHVEGLLTGMAAALNQFAEYERMVLQVSSENVLRGLLAGISIFIRQRPQILGEGPRREPNALFDDTIEATGQTITQSVHDFVHHKLFEYLRYEPGLGRAILTHVAA